MTARNVRKFFREPIWLILIVTLVVGAILGNAFAHEPLRDEGRIAFGRAWRGDPSDARAALAAVFGFQVTIFTLILSLNAMVVKGAAYQYSPRLIPLYVQHAPIRRALPAFALLAGYVLGATRELGLVPDDGVKPRAVISVAVFILFVSLMLAMVDLFRTFRFVRVERVLGLVRDATFQAAKRVRARVRRLPLDSTEELAMPQDASALVAPTSGYVVDVKLKRLVRIARSVAVRARISRGIGDYVDQGDVIGWVASDRGNPVSARVAHDLAATLVISPVRELDYDPALGIRIMVDVANRALGSSANDPYTARQALNQLRSVLRHVGRLPLGDWNVVEADGSARVSVAATHLRDLLSVAVNAPLHYGASDPDVLEGLIDIVLEAGWIARDPEDRAVARTLLERIDQMAQNSEMDPVRLERVRAESIPVRRSLDMDEASVSAPDV
jgi:uncharacterized membrane protein